MDKKNKKNQTNPSQVTNIRSQSLTLEMENNLPTDRIRIKMGIKAWN